MMDYAACSMVKPSGNTSTESFGQSADDNRWEQHASISVIIPAYNADRTIARCVGSVFAGTVKPIEVIIVDDCSNDSTAAAVEALRGHHGDLIRLVRTPQNGGPARARNLGAAAARGDYYFFIDSDTEMLPGTLENFLRRVPDADAVSGIYHQDPLNAGATPRYKALLLAYFFGRRGSFDYDVFVSSSAGICAKVFHAVGGFNEALPWGMDVENEEFGNRIVQHHRLILDPSVNVRHHFPSFCKLTTTYFHRVSLWMELTLNRGRFDRGGNATLGIGLSTAAAGATLASLPLLAFDFPAPIVPCALLLWHLAGYGGFLAYVGMHQPAFFFKALLLNYWFSLVLTAGAAYGAIRWFTNLSRLPPVGKW